MLSLVVTAVSKGKESFAQVNEFVSSHATGEVVSGGCKAFVNSFFDNRQQTLQFDLELPAGIRTVTAHTLVQCLGWSSTADQQRCFSGEIDPPK